MKELEEARKQLGLLIIRESKLSCRALIQRDTNDLIDQILNLKGDGWKIAIVGDRVGQYKTDTTDKAIAFTVRQVIWEANSD